METGIVQKALAVLAILSFLVVMLACPVDAATAKRKSSSANPRYAAIVIDADSGAVLYERSADKKLHPASLVKMMTLLMAFDAIESGNLSLNSRVRISAHAAAQPPSKLGTPVGSSISVKEAIYSLVTKSANDIATALGETIGGSESRFVAMMNVKAREIGMTQTVFRNASGLHNPQMVSTARDMARLSRHLIMNYPKEYKYFSTKSFSYNGVSHRNHNRLMETYQGMDGIKTGYIQPSGFNLAASAVRGDHRLIGVVFGGRTTQSRNAHMAELLDQGFAHFGAGKDVRVAKSIDQTPDQILAMNAPIPKLKPSRRDMLQDNDADGGQQPSIAYADENMAEEATGRELIGEGDFDPDVARRFEAGMMAIAALKSDMTQPAAGDIVVASVDQSSLAPVPALVEDPRAKQIASPVPVDATQVKAAIITEDDWAVQIGAFTSRVRSDQVLGDALEKLPPGLRGKAKPVIVPMRAGDGLIFRARIRGLSREQAIASCKYFENCMAISPRAF